MQNVETMNRPEQLLTYKQVADKLQMCEKSIRDMKDLPRIKIGRAIRFDPQDVRQWIEEKRR